MAEMSAPVHADTLLPFAEADPAASADMLRMMMAALRIAAVSCCW